MPITPAELSKTYDIIVVGGGPAGCVLASRLSENSGTNVLLAEAGGDVAAPGAEHPDVLDPFCFSATDNPAFRWSGLLVEGATAAAVGNGAGTLTPFLQGYGVGGGSNMNGMAADRGLPEDYQEWQDLGATGWDWQAVLPYFKKLERDLDFPALHPSSMHGARGPMPVRRLHRSDWAPFAAAVGDAMQRRGFVFLDDYMTDFREGFSAVPTNCLLDRRVSASMAYLSRDVRSRPNLTILANTRIDRIGFNNRRVEGVLACIDGTPTRLSGRQVIVSGGAIQSPALLLRSGIGPADALARLGIATVHELPGVGANLQNHPSLNLITYLKRAAMQAADNPWFLQNWLRFSSHQPHCAPKDMHLMPFNKCAWHALGRRVGLMALTVLKPYSKGSVQLASADPVRLPKVHFNVLADSRDEDRLVAGLSMVFKLLDDPAVASLRHEIFPPTVARLAGSLTRRHGWNAVKARALTALLDAAPSRRLLVKRWRVDPAKLLASESAMRDFVRKHTGVQAHVCGTCRMGSVHDRAAVVDSAGRVHGVAGLRVADASIFPSLPRGYTHFIVIMAAEKLADAIKCEQATAA